ncbi:hypothetical protein H6G36_17625 [Anabaena minutissima FACHB-250]|nr:hypothetical protein [Anabaena minutissima FACHB-250]
MKAVVTLCIGKEYSLGELTHPLLAAYAKRQKGSKLEQIRKYLSIINNNYLASIVSFLPFIERFI